MKMKLNKTTILVITTAAFFVQLLIITYNHFTGYINITGIGNFLSRIIIGTAFSSLFGLVIVYVDLQIISLFNKYLPFPEKIKLRIPTEFISTGFAGILIGIILTVTAHVIFPYPNGLVSNIINNALIVAVINIMIMSIIEAIIWFKRTQENKVIAVQLKNENTQIKLQILKDQLNPHFLFNSLNTLSTLIDKDTEKAQKFIDEFAMIYRYTLDVIDKPVVELNDEIGFVKSFLYLQKIRFDNIIEYEISVDAEKLKFFVPPLALQTLLENSFKHNRASTESPLKIRIYNEGNFIIVINNLQPELLKRQSSKVGLENLKKRYSILCGHEPEFVITDKEYIAKIPLIIPEE